MKNKTEAVIKVRTYSGYKADERPISFSIDDVKISIINIIDRWIDSDCDFFMAQGNDGKSYVLSHDRERDIWHIRPHP